jgi:hypothetical protein
MIDPMKEEEGYFMSNNHGGTALGMGDKTIVTGEMSFIIVNHFQFSCVICTKRKKGAPECQKVV